MRRLVRDGLLVTAAASAAAALLYAWPLAIICAWAVFLRLALGGAK